ncbi:hypothetical protein BBJ28_00007984 [Nothophytophthora sp. Chile5]|nr:hypothetical protein BBJ28_00007984 [Nothophytophthora sp. Chile5]
MHVATPSDEMSATLSDVLAFIDSCESSDSEPSLDESMSSDGDSGSSLLLDGSPNQPTDGLATGQSNTQHERQAKAKQPRGAHVPQSTKFQREKKREVLELRQHVAELNARFLHLQRTRRDPGTLDTGRGTADSPRQRRGVMSVWEDLAAVQNQERQRAERTNKELKTILARQRKVSHSFRKLLRKKNMLDVRAASIVSL